MVLTPHNYGSKGNTLLMKNPDQFPLLSLVNSPADLRALDDSQLPQFCDELRQFVIESVAVTGGHLGASLGTIELTVALHYIFKTPYDQLVWDVGHQTYGHKIITGRRDRMITMRKQGGLAGFPNRDESEYDTFGVGHSSTSVSAALGMALAARSENEGKSPNDQQKTVAVIGDGALTAGLAYEALNHAGGIKHDCGFERQRHVYLTQCGCDEQIPCTYVNGQNCVRCS